MPVWHEATKQWVKDGKLQIVGVIQEQHPQRCQLFAQWKELDWPIVHDPVNLLGNSAVPIAIAIDEHGIVRSIRPKSNTIEDDFLNVEFDAPKGSKNSTQDNSFGNSPNWKSTIKKIDDSSSAEQLKYAADSLVLWAKESQLDQAIQYYQRAYKLQAKDSSVLFRLGVAFQMRNESAYRQPKDFGRAIRFWSQALRANPNQYIWRRRIQQYGPRLDKPYPFYDWVVQARSDIRKRGLKPIPLPIEPVGAELASRALSFSESTDSKNPDPKNLVKNDIDGLLQIEGVAVPHTYKADQVAMAHVILTPKSGVNWSNEGGPLVVWIEGKNVKVSKQLFSLTNRKKLESNDIRKIEFELSRDPNIKTLNGFALYYVCQNSGQCLYLKQKFTIQLD